MPIPIPRDKQITVERKSFPAGYDMPNHSMATDHYNIRYIVSGDRRTISPTESFSYHSGNVVMTPLYRYNRTMSESSVPYDRYLIKYRPEFAKPFIENVGKNAFDEMYDKSVFTFTPKAQEKLGEIFEDMLTEYNKSTAYKEFILQSMLSRLLSFIWENRLETAVTRYKAPLSEPVLETMYYIENNYKSKITLESAADHVHFSSAHLSRLFSKETAMPFSEYLINIRIRHAQYMLVETDKTITHIALETGYSSSDYFSYQFRQRVGITPTQFRKNAR